MSDCHTLPDNHPLKPLETRMLEMCDDLHASVRLLGGNFVAALRVFAKRNPGLVNLTRSGEVTDLTADLCCAAAKLKHRCAECADNELLVTEFER